MHGRAWISSALSFGMLCALGCASSRKSANAPSASPDSARQSSSATSGPTKPSTCYATAQTSASYVPGTSLSMGELSGYEAAKYFPGYLRDQGRQSIMVTQHLEAVSKIKGAMRNPDLLARRGLTLVKAQNLEHSAPELSTRCPGTLLEVKQVFQGGQARKFVWLFGDKQRTFQVVGTCMEPCSEADAKDLRQSVQRARWNPERPANPWEGFPFTMDAAPLKPLEGVSSPGYMKLFTQDGQASPSGDQASLMFGPSLGPAASPTEAFVKQSLLARPMRDVRITAKSRSTLLGRQGWTIEASAQSATGKELWVTYSIWFDQDTYWLAVGQCPADKKASFKPVFEKMLSTVKIATDE